MKPALVYSEKYSMDWWDHVFPVQKFRMLKEMCEKNFDKVGFFAPERATDAELLLVHLPEYLETLKDVIKHPEMGLYMFEIPCTEQVLDGFRYGSGGTILAAELALKHGCAANLGGGFHHAFPDHGEGFCVLNDLAIAIRVLQKKKLIKKAMVVDCDVHQGNGTAACFIHDDSVFTFDIYQDRNYPMPKVPPTMGFPMPDSAGDKLYLKTLKDNLPGAIERAKPDIVLYQAGADPYEGDRLGNLAITMKGMKERDEIVVCECRRRKIPIVSTTGGGYSDPPEDVVLIHCNTILTMHETS